MARPKKFRAAPGIRRKTGTKKPKLKIYAFCEGKNTEPRFLKDFSKMHGNGLVSVEAIGAAGVPLTIVRSSVEKKKELDRIAKRSKDSLDKAFEVWSVFDRDDHPDIPRAFSLAEGNNVKVAYSNPCFEIWPYIHFVKQTASIHRHDVQRKLRAHIPSYDDKGSKLVCPIELSKACTYEAAKKHAKTLKTQHEEVNAPKANPYTDVYKLLDLIISNGKPSCKKGACDK